MNPALKKNGFTASDRVVIFHADDVSLCQASLSAYADLIDFGIVTSGSVMVPAPWFPATAAYARQYPAADLGLHATLTCEWDGYRWGPLSTRDYSSGLLDEEGYFPRQQRPIWERTDLKAVRVEIELQLEVMRRAGIDVTHLDDHMGVWDHPRFAAELGEFALSHLLPPRQSLPGSQRLAENEWEQAIQKRGERLLAAGVPLFDRMGGLPLAEDRGHEDLVLRFVEDLLPGEMGLLIAHPAADTPELRAIAPDWRARVANYRALTSLRVKEELQAKGVTLLNFRTLRTWMRGEK